MPAALPLQYAIDQDFSADTEYRTLKVQYGNGYSQRALDGINGNISTWSLKWPNLSVPEFEEIVAAFDAAFGVDYFTWKAPGDATTKKWVITKWSRTALSGSYYSVSATLDQVFDIS